MRGPRGPGTPHPPAIGSIVIAPATTRPEIERYFRFAWTVYRGDRNWVPPIIEERLAKVDPNRNPFWRNAERRLWTAERDGEVVGTIAAVHDRHRNEVLRQAARALVGAACGWLAARGLSSLHGPYNPGPSDDMGILVEGFDSRPAIREAHNPPYYARLLEGAGLRPLGEVYARLLVRPPGNNAFVEDAHPRLRRAFEIAETRNPGVSIRPIDRRRWDEDIRTACRLFNAALSDIPDHVPVTEEEFLAEAADLRPLMDDDLALLAEIDGRLDLVGTLRFLWHRRRIRRVSFKILMMAPKFRGRFVEVLIIRRLGEAVWRKGYREVDLSLTGEENLRSNRFQEKTGARIYRRYRIYGREIATGEGENG